MKDENDLRGALLLMAKEAREALVSGDFDKARVSIAGLATWAHEVATLDAVPVFHEAAVGAERTRCAAIVTRLRRRLTGTAKTLASEAVAQIKAGA